MTEYYPGSKTPKRSYSENYKPPSQEPEEDVTLGRSRTFLVYGEPKEFYGMGDLARALERKPGTIRKWESEGVIPNATFVLPSSDQRGQRRLYTEEQIVGLRKIAQEEGLLDTTTGGRYTAIEQTNFRQRALALFKELGKK